LPKLCGTKCALTKRSRGTAARRLKENKSILLSFRHLWHRFDTTGKNSKFAVRPEHVATLLEVMVWTDDTAFTALANKPIGVEEDGQYRRFKILPSQ